MTEAEQAPAEATPAAVWRLLLYYDIFKHPLRAAEIARLCGADPRLALDQLTAAGRISHLDGFYLLPGHPDRVAERRRRAAAAERCWPKAIRAARLLARLPSVEGVLITGALSKQSATPDGDIDFLLLLAPGQVWTTKSMLQVGRRMLPEPIREQFCTNYLLATDRLAIPERNIFTAMELATAVPMVGPAACAALLDQNRAWAEPLLPGYAWSRRRADHAEPLPPRLPAPPAPLLDRLEPALMRAWSGYWDRKYRWLPDAIRAARFKRRPEVATNHLHDFQVYVLDAYRDRCRAAGLDPVGA